MSSPASRAQAARRIAAGLAAIGVPALVAGFLVAREPAADVGTATAKSDAGAARESPYGTPTRAELPPRTRIVAFVGAPQSTELGILGRGLERGADRLERQAAAYRRKTRPVVPAFDLIATVAEAHPGKAGLYRTRQRPGTIARWLRAARRHRAQLILDIQPGGSNFPDEERALERWLREPDVHLALDPEWRMRPGVAPGTQIGWVSGGEVQATLDRVSALVARLHLPPKLVLVHRFTDGMIRDLPTVRVPRGIVPVISVDGVGARAAKVDTYRQIAPQLPAPWRPGFKLFFDEDAEAGGLMSSTQVMALAPRPAVVLYE